MEKLFVRASRQKYRFASKNGTLQAEDLWDLPLTSKAKASLNNVAVAISKDLKGSAEENFVDTPNPEDRVLKDKLEIVKFVISVKKAERDAAKVEAEKKAKRDKILKILAEKQDASLANKSEAELLAELEALG